MWLVNTSTIKPTEFVGEEVPQYAILSHTWGAEEITFQDIQNQEFEHKKAFPKLRDFCKKAALDGFKWSWIDTCCIDKSSSAELSEAINSMYGWYANADICYAYLADVPMSSFPEKFGQSRWFTRGWTLQELIAPRTVEFYSAEWTNIGCKISLKEEIAKCSGIPVDAIQGEDLVKHSFGERMSWASRRHTTRPEDRAYSLMGLFDINMPLLYGEGGPKAFLRLQEEILKSCEEDHTLFIWRPHAPGPRGLLTTSPDDFCTSKTCTICGIGEERDFEYTNLGETFLSTKLLREPPLLTGTGTLMSLELFLQDTKLHYEDGGSEVISLTDEAEATHLTKVNEAASFADYEEAIPLTDKVKVMAALNLVTYYPEDPSRGEILCISLEPHSYRPEQYTRNDFRIHPKNNDWVNIGVHKILVHQKPPRPFLVCWTGQSPKSKEPSERLP